MEVYGNKINFVLEEIDTGDKTTRKVDATSTYGLNFKFNGGQKEKWGIEFGDTFTQSYTQSNTIESTLTSDDLGTATLQWSDPVLYYWEKPFDPNGSPRQITSGIDYYQVTTGTVLLTVSPVAIP